MNSVSPSIRIPARSSTVGTNEPGVRIPLGGGHIQLLFGNDVVGSDVGRVIRPILIRPVMDWCIRLGCLNRVGGAVNTSGTTTVPASGNSWNLAQNCAILRRLAENGTNGGNVAGDNTVCVPNTQMDSVPAGNIRQAYLGVTSSVTLGTVNPNAAAWRVLLPSDVLDVRLQPVGTPSPGVDITSLYDLVLNITGQPVRELPLY